MIAFGPGFMYHQPCKIYNGELHLGRGCMNLQNMVNLVE